MQEKQRLNFAISLGEITQFLAHRTLFYVFSVDWSAIRAGAVARPCREIAAGIY
jgi:hypothetical protein